MARLKDVRLFDVASYHDTVRAMADRGEDVHAAGRQHKRATGALHPLVDVTKNKGSHNSMIPAENGTFVLKNGIALPILSMFDGTGSTVRWLENFFHAAEKQYLLMEGVRPRYNTQQASAVVQDVIDPSPVVQLSQFESDERSAEQVRLLHPDSGGGDATEDYDLGLMAGLFVYTDLTTYYGLKGYFTLTADEIGRGYVTQEGVKKHLGKDMGQFQIGKRLETTEVCARLSEKWHLFFLQVPSGTDMIRKTTEWWQDKMGNGRVIPVHDPQMLAEIRSALIYVTEAVNPTEAGLRHFLGASNQSLDARLTNSIWRTIQVAEQHFGAQAKLPGYHEIPLPGDIFAHYRHAWPIGHSRANENVTPVETTAS